MLIHLLVGALAMWVVLFLVDYAKREALCLSWWQWSLTILNVLYMVFVVEVIYGFLAEGAPQAALVMGLLTAFFGIIWAVLLGRLVFAKPKETSTNMGKPSPVAK